MVKKEVVVIASVLKPVDDTRMYEKMARSLASTGKFCVNILGFFSNTHSEHRDILFHPIFHFKRNHYRRLFANLTFLKAVKKLSPGVIIVSTPELGPAVILYRWFHPGVTLLYDVQENHLYNLRYHHGRHQWLRKWMAKMVGQLEKLLAQKSHCLLVAEKGYFQEMPWLSALPSFLLENKVLRPQAILKPKQLNSPPLSVVYTGTISAAYGIWDALRFVEQLHQQLGKKLSFHLVGHVTQQQTFQMLTQYLRQHPWMQATISEQPVPHQVLINAIEQADVGMVPHQLLPSILHCFPTRIWEYMAHGIPFFLQQHNPWVDYCRPWYCAIPIDFSQQTWAMESIIYTLKQEDFYSRGIPETIYWDKKGFLSIMNDLTEKDHSETTH